MRSRPHGSRTKYAHDGCRCLPCRLANTRYESARYARSVRQGYRVRHVGGAWWVVIPVDGGKVSLRTRDRAEAIRVRDSMNEQWRKQHPVDVPWASAGVLVSARRYLATLGKHGIGIHRVARLSGVSRSRLGEILRGRAKRSDRPERIRMRAATAERILGVMVTQAAPGAIVPAMETWRIVNELLEAGLTRGRIARALGRKTPALQLRKDRILQRNADAVRELHDRAYERSPVLRGLCRCHSSKRDKETEAA